MLNVQGLNKLVKEWFTTVPEDMKDKLVVSNFSIKPMSFTPRQIVKRVEAAARKSITREEFLKETGLCGEFLETLEKMYNRRMEKRRKKS